VTRQTVSARELCDLVGLYSPTDEQEAVIEAPPEGVYRVVAGAGSGKTETMALRVLYLVANGWVTPGEVLGLTFTKKAAGELQTRLVERLALLAKRLPDIAADDPFDRPRVHTYNAFATRIFSDYAVFGGIDSDIQVASAASAWGLARSVVLSSDDTRLAELDLGVDSIASLVQKLSQSLAENETTGADLAVFAERFRTIRDLPPGGRGAYADVDEWVDRVSSLVPLSRLVERFADEKKVRGLVEFGDQVRFALEVLRRSEQVVTTLRSVHKVVLLDEYQDTSVLQAHLLSTLFSDHPVMAVGDPHQAIYGWRGASAGNVNDFPTRFGRTWPSTTFSLSTSWRNSTAVLEAANTLAIPLAEASPGAVVELRAKPDAPSGRLEVSFSETVNEEAEAVANWFWTRLGNSSSAPPTAALLLRHRRHQDDYVRALRTRGIPVHVLGIGGLLSDPVVADLVCGLAVVHRPEANSELVRLLAGGKYQIGVSDLYALGQLAKRLARSQKDQPSGDNTSKESVITPPVSLPETLEWLRPKPLDDPLWEGFSGDGRVRLIAAAELISSRRARRNDDLVDQLVGIERAWGIDVETLSNPERDQSVSARLALFDALDTYQATSDYPSASGFIDWLQEAEWRDNLQPRSEEPEPGCVQVLTIHGAKGLEWDHVAVVRMVDQELPGSPKDGTKGWLTRGEIPYPLRGDRDHLPHFAWEGAESRKDLVDRAKQFFDDVATAHLREERRLMYVAITRSKADVGLFGSWWATQKTPRGPSLFLRELAEAGHLTGLPDARTYDTNPAGDSQDDRVWPGDPLGARRPRVMEAATRVMKVATGNDKGLSPDRVLELDELIARERKRSTPPIPPPIPYRLAASSVASLLGDARAVMVARARPVPRLSGNPERAGTEFHAFVEDHYLRSGQLLLGGDWELDDISEEWQTPDDGEGWREAFLASPFATTTPRAIEREIHLPIAGHLVVCKIDAVFDTDTGVDIIDWKTGQPPKTSDEERARSLQLSLYRLAWAAWAGVDPSTVTAGWWFARTGEVRRPATLLEFDELEQELLQAFQAYESARTKSASA